MLSQRSPSDEYYQQFTIHCLNEPRKNAKDTELYQMLRIENDPINNFEDLQLDLKFFPHLFPYAKNGQYSERKIKLTSSEFVKSQLMSMNSSFRKDSQYLFFLLHESNLRALKAGIYHKLNTINMRTKLTASKCLELLNNNELEGNLTTIFAKLRNTSQYWLNPRSDIETMITWYGPVTFFLTLSPGEYNWQRLDFYLREMNSNVENGKSTSNLISLDSVSTSRIVDNEFKAMLDFITSKDAPLGKVSHYAWRREYQTRGLQHFHTLLWIEGAPIIGENTTDEVVKFISNTITCHKPNEHDFPTISERIEMYQTHKHNSYCMRSKKTGTRIVSSCRFGFP
ncbi:ATP-dependent DNA helicase [Aphis craccivora]|uniref:ATP-dependent DNA helicase n=1 Tax=Aphis craccivora TaxID=307492 RepID=A0A6G0VNT8_APHCR|nr:ATP-dependent DNA helicase [Aphis craccivora]